MYSIGAIFSVKGRSDICSRDRARVKAIAGISARIPIPLPDSSSMTTRRVSVSTAANSKQLSTETNLY